MDWKERKAIWSIKKEVIRINESYLFQDNFVDKLREAAANQGKKDLKRDVILCEKRKRGKYLMQANNLSTRALMNQGIYEMRMKMFEKAVEHFSMVIRKEVLRFKLKFNAQTAFRNKTKSLKSRERGELKLKRSMVIKVD